MSKFRLIRIYNNSVFIIFIISINANNEDYEIEFNWISRNNPIIIIYLLIINIHLDGYMIKHTNKI